MSQNLYGEVLTPVPHNVTVFGDQAFKLVIRLLEWTLIHYDCALMRRNLETQRDTRVL